MRKYFVLLMATSVVLALSACDSGTASVDNAKKLASSNKNKNDAVTSSATVKGASAPVKQSGVQKYVAGGELNYIPFGFRDERGQATGFELELLQEVAKAGNFEVDIINIKRATHEDALNQDSVHIVASALAISSNRLERVDMSEPYLEHEKVFYVLDRGNGLKINTLADLRGKRIAYHRGGGSLGLITEVTGSAENAVPTESVFLALKDLYAGREDAVVGETRVFQYYANNNPQFKGHVIPIGKNSGPFAFAVKKGNQELLQKINNGLAKVKASGTLDALIEKWFGKQVPKK